jgi:hypothetical protein
MSKVYSASGLVAEQKAHRTAALVYFDQMRAAIAARAALENL